MTTADYNTAIKRVAANKSPRYHALEGFESWVNGTQYAGRANWWDDSVPLWERAPCITYPIVKLAIASNVDVMLGERAFPRFALSEHDGAASALAELHRISRFRTVCREAFAAAQACGTACTVYGVRNGRPFADIIPAKWCEPEFADGFTVSKLVIQYPYIDEKRQSDGSYLAVAMLYRRVIDSERDVVYLPAEAPDGDTTKIKWQEDPTRTTSHGLGFCPVVWYAFMRGCVAVNVIDGKPLHDGCTNELEAHDIARSQWHKTSLYSDPQPYEIGVPADHNPTGASGRTPLIPTTEHGGAIHPTSNPVRGGFGAGEAKAARKKGPGYVWRYDNPDAKIGYLLTPGDALQVQQQNVSDLRIKLQEMLAVVFLDPENIKFAATTSGKALEAIKQKQYDRVDQYREDFRDGFLLPSIAMQLRVVQAKRPNLREIDALLAIKPDAIEFACDVQWGSYQAPDFAEQKQIIELVQAAMGGSGGQQLITIEQALGKLQDADVFDIEDIDAAAAALKALKATAQADAMKFASKAPAVDDDVERDELDEPDDALPESEKDPQ